MEQEILYVSTDNLLSDVRMIIDSARTKAYAAVNVALVERNWLLGKRIAEEELQGEERAAYGASVIKKLSKELTEEYGKGIDEITNKPFYTYYEVGKSDINASYDNEKNRFIYDEDNSLFYDLESNRGDKKRFDVVQVRPNDGTIV
jgi:hypothetical protein